MPVEFKEGIVVAGPQYLFRKNEKAKSFEDKFKTIYGNPPNFDAAFAYDAVNILSEGLIKGNGDENNAYKIITAMSHYDGIMGKVSIDKEGGLDVPMGLGIIKNGVIAELEQ